AVNPISFTVPAGEALVITDVEWDTNTGSASNQGKYGLVFVTTNIPGTNGTTSISLSSLVDAAGVFAGQTHFTTGIVLPPGSFLPASQGGGTDALTGIVLVQGYLVPNQ